MALVHAQEEQGLLEEICRLCVERGGYRLAWVGYALHDEGRTVRLMAQCGDHDGTLQHLPVSWADVRQGRGPGGTALPPGQPLGGGHNSPPPPPEDSRRKGP